MFRKIISVVLCTVISLSCVILASAKDDGGAVKGRPVSDGGLTRIVYYDQNGQKVDMNDAGGLFTEDSFVNYSFPKKYDARDYNLVTGVKDQDPFGTCWAFSCCSAAETSLIKQGYETKSSVNLSEAHLVYFTGFSTDSGAGTQAEYDELKMSDIFNSGGSSILTDTTLARGSGFTKESAFPYSTDESKMHFSNSDKYKCDYQLVYSQTHVDFSVESAKKDILEYGSIMMSYHGERTRFYNNSKDGYCYYCPLSLTDNHSVTVIGWDDSFSADNFLNKPAGNGAWLVKNSWGTNWGDGGYFWLSYYDPTIYDYTALKAVPAGSYSKIYQYDGNVCLMTLESDGNGSMANIFTSEKSGESVAAASFTLSYPVCYSANVSLYTGLKNNTDPTSGTLRETQSIVCNSQGYYVVDFNDTYSVKKGEKFSVVVTLISYTDFHQVPVEGGSDSGLGMDFKMYSDSNQSFVNLGSGWEDASAEGYNNVPVKALTVNSEEIKSLAINTLPEKTKYYVGNRLSTDGLSLVATLKSGKKKIITGGFSCNTDKLTSAGTKNVTVTYMGKSVTFSVTVSKMPADAIKGIQAGDVSINAKQSGTIPVTVKSDGKAKYEITYISGNDGSVYVDSDGNYYGIRRGSSTVTCIAADEYGNVFTDTCTVTVNYTFGQWLIIILLFGWIWYI